MNEKSFEVGDRVKCVWACPPLEKGAKYEIAGYSTSKGDRFAKVKGLGTEFFADRFELIEKTTEEEIAELEARLAVLRDKPLIDARKALIEKACAEFTKYTDAKNAKAPWITLIVDQTEVSMTFAPANTPDSE